MFDKIILHVPHSSIKFPTTNSKDKWCGDINCDINTWTDFFTDQIFESKLDKQNISQVKYPYSRFYCDVERLINDVLENIGQGIIYNKTNCGCDRMLNNFEKDVIMESYYLHHNNLSNEIIENSLIIDCHSFPSHLSDIDICIGFNEDNTKPNNEIIKIIVDYFKSNGYIVGINNPFSNSISPKSSNNYKSIMIEVNKKLYMNEELQSKHSDFYKINHLMNSLYKILLNK